MNFYKILFFVFSLSCFSKQESVVKEGRVDVNSPADSTFILNVPNKKVKLVYSNFRKGVWQKLTLEKNGFVSELRSPFQNYGYAYEISSPSDFSINQNYVILHLIDQGTIETDEGSLFHSKYNCAVLDIGCGCTGNTLTAIICGGEWSSEEEDVWIFEGEKKIRVGVYSDFEEFYENVFSEYKNREYFTLKSTIKSIKTVDEFLACFTLSSKTLPKYNDIAFFLEQAGLFEEAALILEKVTEKFPDRIVAYINLGDSYWGLEEKQKAKEAYQTYVSLMKKTGKEARIPKRVYERVQ